jgi:hypothetical protein
MPTGPTKAVRIYDSVKATMCDISRILSGTILANTVAMKIRILHPPQDIIDDIDRIYDLSPAFASVLIREGRAEPADGFLNQESADESRGPVGLIRHSAAADRHASS